MHFCMPSDGVRAANKDVLLVAVFGLNAGDGVLGMWATGIGEIVANIG